MIKNSNDIRWKQRFQNYEKAFQLLERALRIRDPSEVEQGGIIQFYEMAFELAWKLMKDYLEEQGFTVKTPRQSIKQAFQVGVIEEGHVWMDALDDRNVTTHTYDETMAMKVVSEIRNKYFSALQQLYTFFNKEIAS